MDPNTPPVDSALQASLQFRQPQFDLSRREARHAPTEAEDDEAYVVKINPRVLARSRSRKKPETEEQP